MRRLCKQENIGQVEGAYTLELAHITWLLSIDCSGESGEERRHVFDFMGFVTS
jgi:hypothetical protein